jgi:two-component system sensor histidine kinase RegB
MVQSDLDRLEPGESSLRLHTALRLRWFGVFGQLATVAFVYLWLKFDMAFGLCLVLIAASAWLNVFLRIRYSARHRLSANLATSLFAYDIVQLGALL